MNKSNDISDFNEFNEDNDMAEGGKLEPFWNEIYKNAFPDSLNKCKKGQQGKCKSQEQGIDRILEFKCPKTLKLDEKVRREVYSDFALEYISNDKKNTQGWMEKKLLIDYLAYAFLPIKTVYLLDWKKLKRIWNKFKEEWKDKYPIARAKNYNRGGKYLYTTHSVCVPIKEILLKMESSDFIIVKL